MECQKHLGEVQWLLSSPAKYSIHVSKSETPFLMELKLLEKYLWFLVVKAYHRFVPHTCPNVPKRPYDRRTLEWPYFDTVIIHCARNRKRLSVKTKKRYERRFRKVKFIYSEKATKFCKIFLLLLTVFTVVKSKAKISHDFIRIYELYIGR